MRDHIRNENITVFALVRVMGKITEAYTKREIRKGRGKKKKGKQNMNERY